MRETVRPNRERAVFGLLRWRDWVGAVGLFALLVVSSTGALEETNRVETNSVGMEMVCIPAGEFRMGSSPAEIDSTLASMQKAKVGDWYLASPPSEGPQHRVKITRPFFMGIHEVTVGEFRKFVEGASYRTDAERDGRGGFGHRDGQWQQRPEFSWKDIGSRQDDNQAVVNVSWQDAAAFCRWLSDREGKKYRLPTEAEWEYACRAGQLTRFPWGDDASQLSQYAWHGANSGGVPHRVGQLKPNPFGLYDMLGNVYEYCLDLYSPEAYQDATVEDPPGPNKGKEHVVRGGSWGTNPMHCRPAFRGGDSGPGHRNQRDGFRVVRQP